MSITLGFSVAESGDSKIITITDTTGTATGDTTGATGTGTNTTGGTSTGTNTAGGTGTTTGATTGATGAGTITGGAGTGTNTTGGTSTSGTSPTGGTTAGTGTAAGVVAGILAGIGTGSGSGSGSGTTGTTSTTSTTGTSTLATNKSTPGKATFSKGTQIADPFSVTPEAAAAQANVASSNPLMLQEIQMAKNGGIIHRVDGGPVFLKGHDAAHANLFGSRGAQLTGLPHLQNGGPAPMYADAGRPTSYEDRTLPEAHNPQFFSEGGLGSLHNRYVQGAGDGTSDSIPAMLANGEFVIPADVVSSLGNGSNESGAHVLDAFLKTVREHKQKHDAKHLPPDSKGALAYLLQAKQKVSK